MANKNTYKVTLMQAGVIATFRLNDKEYKQLKIYAIPQDKDRLYNFSAFAWADYELSRSKMGRFHSIFDYHKGDFYIFDVEEI